jgi:hypothetical protein
MNRILDALTAIGATVLVLVLGWLILYPRRERDEWVRTGRRQMRRKGE